MNNNNNNSRNRNNAGALKRNNNNSNNSKKKLQLPNAPPRNNNNANSRGKLNNPGANAGRKLNNAGANAGRNSGRNAGRNAGRNVNNNQQLKLASNLNTPNNSNNVGARRRLLAKLPPRLITAANQAKLYTNNATYQKMRATSLNGNKLFRLFTLDELAELNNHSQEFVGKACRFRIYDILSKQEDVESIAKTRKELMGYLQLLDKGNGVNWDALNNKSNNMGGLAALLGGGNAANSNNNAERRRKKQMKTWAVIKASVPSSMIPSGQRLFRVNGSEIVWQPELFSMSTRAAKSGNCYSWAVSKVALKRNQKPQPGNWSKNNPSRGDPVLNNENARIRGDCPDLLRRVLADIKGSYVLKYNKETQELEPCKKGFYPIYMMVAKENNGIRDYHFAKMTDSGLWTHKRGASTLSLALDAKGQLILNPAKANWNYGNGQLHYNTICHFIAIPTVHY